jgi:hypothetical protein
MRVSELRPLISSTLLAFSAACGGSPIEATVGTDTDPSDPTDTAWTGATSTTTGEDPETESSSGGEPGTGTESDAAESDSTGTAGGSTRGESTDGESSRGSQVCELDPLDDACTACARAECCDAVEACFADSACACIGQCVLQGDGTPPECAETCGAALPWRLLSPIQSCVDAGCGECSSSGGEIEPPIDDLCEPDRSDASCASCVREHCCDTLETCGADDACLCVVGCLSNQGEGVFDTDSVAACSSSCDVEPPTALLEPIELCAQDSACDTCIPEGPMEPEEPS